MKTEWKSTLQKPSHIVDLDDYRQSASEREASSGTTRIMVEVASNSPVGEEIRTSISKSLEDLDGVIVSDQTPEWVFSIIAFQYMDNVELSLVVRRLFRSTAPGTEMMKQASTGKDVMRKGGWVYESMRFHGLYGVPQRDLGAFLDRFAREFGAQQLGLPQNRKIQT